MPIDCEIGQGEERPESAALPKSKWNDAFARPFRGQPLNEKTETENDAPSQPDDFPGVKRDSENFRVAEKKNALHSFEFRGEGVQRPVFSQDRFRIDCSGAIYLEYGKSASARSCRLPARQAD